MFQSSDTTFERHRFNSLCKFRYVKSQLVFRCCHVRCDVRERERKLAIDSAGPCGNRFISIWGGQSVNIRETVCSHQVPIKYR